MKKRMCKIMALAMTAAMVVPMAAQTTVFAADDKEITYWNIAVESPDKDIVTAAVDKFNKETKSGYTVNQVAIQNDTYKEKLVIAMSSGECPDCLLYTSNVFLFILKFYIMVLLKNYDSLKSAEIGTFQGTIQMCIRDRHYVIEANYSPSNATVKGCRWTTSDTSVVLDVYKRQASIFDYKPETFIDEENYEENKKLNKEEVHFDKF